MKHQAPKLTFSRRFAGIVLLIFLLPLAPVYAQTTGVMEIWAGTTLTQDHVGNIRILADNVTLDCDDHTVISADTGNGIGISIDSREDVTVQNCHVSGFGRGFSINSATHVTLLNNSSTHNSLGIDFIHTPWATVDGNWVYGNSHGISLVYSPNGLIQNNVSENNVNTGIRVIQLETAWILDNVITGVVHGIQLLGSNDVTVTGNLITSTHDAIRVVVGSNDNLIGSNTVVGSTNIGILLRDDSLGNVVDSNGLTSNVGGIFLHSGANLSEITGNTVTLSRIRALSIASASNENLASGNTFELNCIGVHIETDSSANQIFNNNFINNGTQAEELPSAGPNTFSSGSPESGNYWNDFDELAEGCLDDSPGDGLCDASYLFAGGVDALPWTEKNGWLGSGGGQVDDSVTVDPCTSTDFDSDNVPDATDNCPFDPNPDQADNDEDGAGDECDPDDDNDGVDDVSDNCPFHYNPGQEDSDGNGVGDACTFDEDGDGVPNESDNCPGTSPGLVVSEDGCSGGQLIDLECDAEDFPNHGLYVSCVAHRANEAAWAGLITQQEKAGFITQAAHSDH